MKKPGQQSHAHTARYSLKPLTPARPGYSLRPLVGLKSRGAKRPPFVRRHKRVCISLAAGSVVAVTAVAWVNGSLSRVANAYPPVEIGAKTVSLQCNYQGEKLTTSLEMHSNINSYYHTNSRKNGVAESGSYKQFVYANSQDDTIPRLAADIRKIGTQQGMNDDQVLELATCFIQNIPYDDAKGTAVLSGSNLSEYNLSQYPYETLYKNSGICTDKTYLGSALLRELGYGTAIYMFPDDQHMALGLSVPAGYTSFNSKYTIIELTNTGFAPGEIPSAVDNHTGRPSVAINNYNDLTASTDPTTLNFITGKTIDAPTLVMDVNEGKSYQRIVAVKQLEQKIETEYESLERQSNNLDIAYADLVRRDRAQESAYSYYLSLPSTKEDCGYKYNYSYSYSYSPYSYTSPYTYKCETVRNPSKSYAYSSYLGVLGSYNSQVDYYNGLISSFNANLRSAKADVEAYKAYDYN